MTDFHTNKTGFWRRQFVDEPTRWQIVFDVLFAVLIPLATIFALPVEVRDALRLDATPPNRLGLLTAFVAIEALLLVACLAGRLKGGLGAAAQAGGLAVGAGYAFKLWFGVPALAGLFYLFGLFGVEALPEAIPDTDLLSKLEYLGYAILYGICPLICGGALARNAVRVWRRAWRSTDRVRAAVVCACCILVLAAPIPILRAIHGYHLHGLVDGSITDTDRLKAVFSTSYLFFDRGGVDGIFWAHAGIDDSQDHEQIAARAWEVDRYLDERYPTNNRERGW